MLTKEPVKEKFTKEYLRELILDAKERKGMTWEQVGQKLGRNAVGAATICYGYGACEEEEADNIIALFDLPLEAKIGLMKAPHRIPAQPWPPTDPVLYRFYEALMLYGPAWKEVCHEIFGDGIISAIDASFDIEKKVVDGINRAVFTFEGKWLVYKKF
jgi:cyanate lyase